MSIRICFFVLILAYGSVQAATIEIFSGDDLRSTLLSLSAGDELIVNAGSYTTQSNSGSWFFEVAWNGTAASPIVVRAAAGTRPIIQGDPSQNVINIDGSFFEMRGFEITGGSHGLRLGNVDNATFEDLVIHDVGDVGLSCNRPNHVCDSLVVRRNEIYNTGKMAGPGEGMYIGCNNAACVVSDSLFEQNYLHDLSGSQADGIEIKTGSYGNTLRDNVIVGAKFPGITMYGYAEGPGRTRNIVERNFIWNTQDNGIQLVGQAIVRNNIVVASGNNGIQSKSSQGFVPHDFEIVHNTVYQAGAACLKGNNWGTDAIEALVANNALYCSSTNSVRVVGGDGQATIAGNVGVGSISGITDGVVIGNSAVADLGNPAGLIFWPPLGSALLEAGVPQHRTVDDFNGVQRPSVAVEAGAYERVSNNNPGWPLQSEFKPVPFVIFLDGFESGTISTWPASSP